MTVLFVIATILFFLALDWLVRKFRGAPEISPQPAALQLHYPMRIPQGIFFAKTHTWLHLLPSGTLRVGIDDFVGRLFEKPELTLLRKSGEEIRAGEPIFALASGGRKILVRSPIDGRVLQANTELAGSPENLKERLFSDGWGYVILPKRVNQLREMLLGSETREWIRGEFRRLVDFLAGATASPAGQPAFLQDGGLPVPGILQKMDAAAWEKFDHDFLQNQ